MSDEELVGRYLADPQSEVPCVNELFQRHYSRVAAWCYRLTGDRDSAADLAQEVFAKAYLALRSFRGDAKFTTWLYIIARNHCLNELKARLARLANGKNGVAADLAHAAADPLADLEKAASVQLIRDLMRESLDEVELKVMVLHYIEELPLEAITRVLGLNNASGAKAHIVNARRKLSSAYRRWRARTGPAGRREAHGRSA